MNTSCVHNKEISLIEVPSSEVLITASLDNVINVWRVTPADFIKTHTFTATKDLIQIQYCHRNQMIAFLDVEFNVGVIPLELSEVTEPQID
jgi:WD40 repeat protein